MTMNYLRTTIAVVCVFAGATAGAEDAASPGTLNGDADQCFAETRKAVAGAAVSELSAASCRRALRHDPISRQDRSAMLHNRGLIQQALGELEKARASFAHAVRLSTTVDVRNLALAQVAHRLGDFELAVEQYDLWIAAVADGPTSATLSTVVANREIAAASIGTIDVASRQ
jgi:tetratricopeptide (TPR) repeat protein